MGFACVCADLMFSGFVVSSGGHGLCNTTATGELLAAAIDSGDQRYRLFAPFTPCFAMGNFGRIAAQLEISFFEACDAVREWRLRTGPKYPN